MAKKTAARKGAAKTRSAKKGSGKGVWLAVLFVMMAVVALVVWRKYGQSNVVPAEVANYEVFGVDVSKHSGKINWLNLKSANVYFAYVKATEGEDYIDPLYSKNYNGAKENGIIVGVYHFFRFSKSGRVQARHFLKNAKIKKGDLVPVVDIEEWGNTLSTRPVKDVILEIGRFLNEVELAIGCRPIIYTNRDTYNRYIKGQYENYPLWLCHLDDAPTSAAPRWAFWQYTHKGEISGAPHPIDFNVYRYSLSDLKARYTIK